MTTKQTIKKSALVPTILVSGGAGFIGSHLVEALLEKKARVVVLDNFNTGKEIHVNHLLKNPNFALYNIDINDGLPNEIESVDYIFHLAGLEEYQYSKDYLNLNSLLTNSAGTKNLLDLARSSQAKFLLASTIDVYQGRMSQLDIDEYFGKSTLEDNKFSLTEAKRFAEAVVWEYFKKYNTDARIVRLPEVYGPRMSLEASGTLGSFLKNIIEGQDISVYGDGMEKEYYLHVKDVVTGLVKAEFNPHTAGNIYSLVDGEPSSILEMAYLVKKLADGVVDVVYKTKKKEIFDYSKIPDDFNTKDLGWSPKISMNEGIINTLEYFGYHANTHSFKPDKFVEEKEKSKMFSLQGVKDMPKKIFEDKVEEKKPKRRFVKEESIASNVSSTEDYQSIKTGVQRPDYEDIKKFVLPKIKLFKLGRDKSGKDVKSTFNSRNNIESNIPNNLKRPLYVGLGILLSALLVFIIFPLLSTSVSLFIALNSLKGIQNSINELDSQKTSQYAYKSSKYFAKSKNSFERTKWMFKLTDKEENFYSVNMLLSSLSNFSKAGYSLSTVVEPLESLWLVLRPDTGEVLDISQFEKASLAILNAKQSFMLAEADYSYVIREDLPKMLHKEFDVYGSYISLVEDNLDFVSNAMSELPKLMGMAGEKKYIIWFQNSNEIRPTGGFIGSYGLLTFDNGKIKDLKIDDIYNPDGQLDVRDIVVEPPLPIKEFLEEDKLYLRNSNWDPDFELSTKLFDDLYYKLNGDKIDGYVAIDLYFVKGLLDVLGPVYLSAYDEEITSENLYERSQFHSSYDYVDGSDSKKSFLTILGSKLLEKIFALENKDLVPVLSEIGKSLDERHFMMYFSNSTLNASLSEKSWDGKLIDTNGDYLYVVNANLGGTKSNYYVKNKMTYEISSMTRDGFLRANLYLDYNHTGVDNAWPGGPYKDYVRVLSQSGSKLTGAKIIYSNGNKEDLFEKILVSESGKYTVFETSFILNPSDSIQIVFSYDLPQNLSLTKDLKKYELYWQKQPGTHDDDFTFVFKYPFGMEISSYSKGLIVGENSFGTSGKLNTDINYLINFR